MASTAGRAWLSATPRVRSDGRGDEVGIADGLEGHEPDAVRDTRRRRSRRPGATGASCRSRPGPVNVSRRVRDSRSAASATSRSRPTNVVSWVGRLFGRASSDRSGGKSDGRPSTTSWASRSGARRSLSRCSPRSRRPMPVRQAVGDEGPRRVGEQDLAAVGDGGDPGRPVDVESDERSRRPSRPRPMCRPIRTRTTASSGQGSSARARWAATAAATADRALRNTTKNESPSVPCSSPSCASNAARSSARCRSRSSRVARGADAFLEAGRALDVAEQEGRGPRRPPGAVRSSGACHRRYRFSGSGPPVRSRSRPASPRMTASATTGSSRMTASKSHDGERQAGGRSVGDDLRDPRHAVEHRELAEEVARAESRDDGPVADDPGAAAHDDEEPGPDLALAGDDVVGAGTPPRPPARRSAPCPRRRRRRTAGVAASSVARRSWVSVMHPPGGAGRHAAPRERRASTRRAVRPALARLHRMRRPRRSQSPR